MNSELIDLKIPADLYQKLQQLAIDEKIDPVSLINQLVTHAYQHRRWLNTLDLLCEKIQEEGGENLTHSQEEIIEKMRQTREEIFEADYIL